MPYNVLHMTFILLIDKNSRANTLLVERGKRYRKKGHHKNHIVTYYMMKILIYDYNSSAQSGGWSCVIKNDFKDWMRFEDVELCGGKSVTILLEDAMSIMRN
jgi:hypothetical protein